MRTDRQTEQPMKDEMGWKEKEQGREKNKDREIDEIEVEREREERDSKILPDFGRICGKVKKQILSSGGSCRQHLELDLSKVLSFFFLV